MRTIERYFYAPSTLQKILAICLLPISFIYAIIATLKRKLTICEDFGLPIVSVGNLVLGGSGKSPFIIEIAKDYEDVCVILRGYGRKSRGLKIVSIKGEIKEDVLNAGDEALMIAKALPKASVIVCKKRREAIFKAKEMGAKAVFLDDGFRFNFKKLNIILKPKLEPYFSFCVPSGGYRELKSAYKEADILAREGEDYKREVKVLNKTERMFLLTAIANPSRLEEYLPSVVGKMSLKDHSYFPREKILEEYQKVNATSLLVTPKDAVKLEEFGLPLSILSLELVIKNEIKEEIKRYIEAS
ncbi:tetraacyldisaccharide 4'-kinase [Helicobacter valdiviensis]|uniref:Tetraacyldisaccharide 4'-kinase n=1 Tax=Helicobacter valdiviensis TaxID=1458358 RepID=A0A2W6MSI9_9HELI|nr:tetraacyldisaccharide 4'-kinase [Helicobacter valdiviensis]PZT47457.1 tetraacyldisaccharide 4'-kinase [Helicobacter valdiviensis]